VLTTGCNGCHFLRNTETGKGCAANQLLVQDQNKVFAPGFCRICRSSNWVEKNAQDQTDDSVLNLIRTENAVSMDLIVVFDENRNDLEDLCFTINNNWHEQHSNKIIIADITGPHRQTNSCLEYIKRFGNRNSFVDTSTQKQPLNKIEDITRRVSRIVESDMFMVVIAGSMIAHFDILCEQIQNIPQRVIHWSFPFFAGRTMVVPYLAQYGLFLTKPYRRVLTNSSSRDFSGQLKLLEEETKIALSCLCNNNPIITRAKK